MSEKDTPIELTIVAMTFLIYGIWSLIRCFTSGFSTSIGILGIPIYFGLLRYSYIWRIWALIFACATILVTPLLAFFIAFHRVIGSFMEYDAYHFSVLKTIFLTIFYIFAFFVAVLQYKILTKDDIRILFIAE